MSLKVAQLIATKTNKTLRHNDHVVEFFYTHGVTSNHDKTEIQKV